MIIILITFRIGSRWPTSERHMHLSISIIRNLSINLQMTRGSCSTWSSSNERKWVSNECGERSETFNRNVLVEIAIAVKLSLNGGW